MKQRFAWMKPFDESDDKVEGPTWLKNAFKLTAAATGALMLTAFYCAVAAPNQVVLVWSLAVACFAVMTGMAWHLGMHGRAKNGLLLATLLVAALFVLSK